MSETMTEKRGGADPMTDTAALPRIKPEIIDELREWAAFEQDGGNVEQGAAIDAMIDWYDRWLRASPAPDRVSVKPLPEAFVTSQSGEGEYAVHIKCQTMSDMHQWHDAVLDAYRNTLSEDKS